MDYCDAFVKVMTALDITKQYVETVIIMYIYRIHKYEHGYVQRYDS